MLKTYTDFTAMYAKRTLVAREKDSDITDRVETFLKHNARRVNHNIYHLWDSSVRYRIDTQQEPGINMALDFTARTKKGLRKSMDIVLAAFPETFEEYSTIPDPLFQIRVGVLYQQIKDEGHS